MTYNLTNISRPVDMLTTANSLTSNLFGSVVVLLVFIITFMYLATKDRPFGYAFSISAYLTMLITVMMRVMSLIPDWVVYLSIIMTLGGVAFTVFSRD